MILNGIIFIILLGVFLWLANLQILSLGRDWPLILILIGTMGILRVFGKDKKKRIIKNLEKGKISVEEAEEQLKKTK